MEIISEDIPGWLVANEGNVTIALDVTLTDSLRREGIARDIVNRVQNIRKDRGFNITDKISLEFEANPMTDEAIKEYGEYIGRQVLADSVVTLPSLGDEAETLEIDDIKLRVRVSLNN